MYNNLEELISHPVFYYFAEISKIPRGSGNEKSISDYLVRFAQDRDLDVVQDKSMNVIIKKAATEGYSHSPTVIIQGHMDMVCEKNQGTNHDFEKDPLQLRIIGDMLYATDTTLGADNGIAVAYALALLDSNDIPHPALEVVITTEEETTMKGALAVDAAHFNGKILINIDSEEDGKLLVSSAGGVRVVQKLPIKWDNVSQDKVTYCVSIKGLKGGHSGISIDKGRGNSNKLLGRLLHDLTSEFSCFIQQISGGLKSNAIPREAEAIILFQSDDLGKITERIELWDQTFKTELQISDPGISVSIEKREIASSKVLSKVTANKAISSLLLIPDGVQGMSMGIEGLVESSTNLGFVSTNESEIAFVSEIRSSVKSVKSYMVNQAKLIANLLECEVTIDSDYPEWPYNPKSKVMKLFEETYQEKYGKNIEVIAVHAGIECGVFIEKIPGLDAVSIGPDIFHVHTPEEHVSIPSTINNWEYFIYTLKRMKDFYGEQQLNEE
ncbi:aminoacyl-histidine dipeptidase [Psychrobacillus vulpis]|uniref:Cytosol non-specific dipeptidase n=1 Tax=Psychrobacillus vulpis TaxID=2325572 RepID=A0A544TTG1_9BACI|nr:aminoacyl-histidine dipeptidase [Psychrobacillus vulpis]TQR20723.1 aminoacyl-histidine dipeptidase [Psychrobacillus vulpis]